MGWTDEREHGGLYSVYWHHSKPGVSVCLEDEQEYSRSKLLEIMKPCFDDGMKNLLFLEKLWASVNQVPEG